MAFGAEILNMIKRVREQEMERRKLCPICEYELSETDDGILYCEWDGWIEGLSLKGRRYHERI